LQNAYEKDKRRSFTHRADSEDTRGRIAGSFMRTVTRKDDKLPERVYFFSSLKLRVSTDVSSDVAGKTFKFDDETNPKVSP